MSSRTRAYWAQNPISDFLIDDSLPSAEDDLIRRESNTLVCRAMRELTPQEKAVISYRFGLLDGRSRTLMQVGLILKISRERVRQVENQAKRRLRRIFCGMRSIRSLPKSPRLPDHTSQDRTPVEL